MITDIAEQNDLPFFIIGATARDIIFEHAHGIKAPRATRDIDLAVQVATWQDFEQLKNQLLATGQLTNTNMTQRLRCLNEIPVDIVPFGDIATNGNISWPPEYSIEMTVAGFQEAYDNTQLVRLRESPKLDVHVVTPVGLMVLKILAWKERYPQAKKDASDIAFILRNTVGEWNRNLLYEQYEEIIDAEDYDELRAGARMLGGEIAKMLSSPNRQILLDILENETGDQVYYRLVEDMRTFKDNFNENLELLEALSRGLHDEPPK